MIKQYSKMGMENTQISWHFSFLTLFKFNANFHFRRLFPFYVRHMVLYLSFTIFVQCSLVIFWIFLGIRNTASFVSNKHHRHARGLSLVLIVEIRLTFLQVKLFLLKSNRVYTTKWFLFWTMAFKESLIVVLGENCDTTMQFLKYIT